MGKGLARAKTTNNSFIISATNDLGPYSAKAAVRPGAITAFSERELSTRTADWPVTRLVEIWNKLRWVTRVTTFTDRQTAVRRIWNALQEGKANPTADTGTPSILSKGAGRPDTKTVQIIGFLRQPTGATLHSIMDLTGWQAHSIPGAQHTGIPQRPAHKEAWLPYSVIHAQGRACLSNPRVSMWLVDNEQ